MVKTTFIIIIYIIISIISIIISNTHIIALIYDFILIFISLFLSSL